MALDNLKRSLDGVFDTPKKATLVGPSGDRVAVVIDSPQAKTYFSKGYKLETQPQISNVTVTSGTGNQLPAGSVNTNYENPMMTAYNNLLMDSLKKAQGVDTIELLKRRRELERKAITERTASAPTGYETLSPSQLNQIRQSNVKLVESDIDENAYQLAKAEKAIANFEDIFFKAQQFGQDFAEKMVLPEQMIENYKKIIEADPDKMTTILSTLNDKSKQAVLGSLDYTKLGKTTDLTKRNVQVMGEYVDPATGQSKKRYGYFDESGNVIYTDQATGTDIEPEQPGAVKKTKEFNDWISSFNGTITQDFTTPVSYFKDGRTEHNAYDIAGKMGQAITSPVSGTVISVTNEKDGSGWGNSLLLKDQDGNTWRMSHFEALAVRPGDTVKAGSQVVGYLGNTGYVLKGDGTKPTQEQLAQGAGTHLHIEAKDSKGNFMDIAGIGKQPTTTNPEYDMPILVSRLGKQIYGTRISDAESSRVQRFVNAGMNMGKSENDIIDDVLGYKITGDKQLADSLKTLLLQNTGESGLAGFDMLGLARLINDKKNAEAITKAELMVYNNAKKVDPDGFISESKTKSFVEQANNISTNISKLEKSPVGVVSGSIETWLGKLKGKDAAQIRADVTQAIAKMRNELIGSAMTEAETRMLEPITPSLQDTPANFMIKVNSLKKNPLIQLNNFRTTYSLPTLDQNSLFNKQNRYQLYIGSEVNNQGSNQTSSQFTSNSGNIYNLPY